MLAYLWNNVVGWVGVGTCVIAALTAVAYFSPIVRIRQWAIWAAITTAIIIGVYAKGWHDKHVYDQAKLQQAEQAARALGHDARAAAIDELRRGVLRDPYDSDDN